MAHLRDLIGAGKWIRAPIHSEIRHAAVIVHKMIYDVKSISTGRSICKRRFMRSSILDFVSA